MINKSDYNTQTKKLKKGFLTQESLDLANIFLEQLQKSDFDIALSAFENKVLNLELTDDEFTRYNNSANILKIINKTDSSLFDAQYQNSSRGTFWCFVAIIYLSIAITGLILCATIILCIGAIANLVVALHSVEGDCDPYNK